MNRLRTNQYVYALVCMAFGLCIVEMPSNASAQTTEETRTRAKALYDEALQKMDAKQPEAACPLLEQVIAALPEVIGAKLTLAECYAQTGKLASAFELYISIEEQAALAGQESRRKKAAENARTLEPQVARLNVLVPESMRRTPGLVVTRDSVLVSPAQWGIPMPVDRGSHTVELKMPNRPQWSKTVSVESDGVVVTVEFEEPAPTPVSVAPEKPLDVPSPPKIQASIAKKPVQRSPTNVRHIVGGIGVGLGALGLGLGTGFGVSAIRSKIESDAGHCDARGFCDAQGMGMREDSIRAGNVSTTMFVVGAAALATGVIVFVTNPAPKSGPTVGLEFGPGQVIARYSW